MKTCRKCGERKPFSEYVRMGGTLGLRPDCRVCENRIRNERYASRNGPDPRRNGNTRPKRSPKPKRVLSGESAETLLAHRDAVKRLVQAHPKIYRWEYEKGKGLGLTPPRAQSRAYATLRHRFPKEMLALYAEEKAKRGLPAPKALQDA